MVPLVVNLGNRLNPWPEPLLHPADKCPVVQVQLVVAWAWQVAPWVAAWVLQEAPWVAWA
jgi:hypothetical protein